LHEQRVMHGDLYAHNILHNGQGRVLLGDFGAASFVPANDPLQAQALQQLEVRAFGCLLEELIDRGQVRPQEHAAWETLVALKAQCLQADPQARPLFVELKQKLD